MATVFRIATEQAIKEIVEENSVSGRFGLIVTEENVAEISKRVVDLFEMTLELRSKTQDIFGQAVSSAKQEPSTKHSQQSEERVSFPKTRNAAEIYAPQENKRNTHHLPELTPNLSAKLPRKRFELTLEEKEKFMRR